jgi:Lrp/AsnC family leucine-responsive transcriptional regulator
MDATDIRILETLQADAHTTQAELAREVGLTQSSVAERIHKLEDKGIIKGYVAKVDAALVGRELTAFIGVSIEHPRFFEDFAAAVEQIDDILECHRVAGEDSYLLKVKTTHAGALDELLVGRLRVLPGVTRTHTTIVLRSVKEETLIRVASHAPAWRSRCT